MPMYGSPISASSNVIANSFEGIIYNKAGAITAAYDAASTQGAGATITQPNARHGLPLGALTVNLGTGNGSGAGTPILINLTFGNGITLPTNNVNQVIFYNPTTFAFLGLGSVSRLSASVLQISSTSIVLPDSTTLSIRWVITPTSA